MREILRNYRTSILLLTGVIIGGICGIVFGEATVVVKPIGDLFLNLMFTTIVPLIFFSISAAITRTSQMSRLGKILRNTIVVFFATGISAGLLTYFAVLLFNPVANIDPVAFEGFIASDGESEQALTTGEMIVNLFSVSDFKLLFDRGTLLPLIIFTIAFGIATASLKEKAQAMADFLNAGSEVILKIIGYIMKLAPIGLGCYFAYTVGQLGSQLISEFVNIFIFYLIMTVIYFFGMFTIYAFIAGKKQGVKAFWSNALAPSLAAIATSSSAACIPVNLIHTRKMGVPEDIVDTAIPLGANIHKDGSVISCILKIIFLFALTGRAIAGLDSFFIILGLAILASIVVGGIPSGGATAEILILSLLGLDMNLLGLIMIIATIVDIPATLLNSAGNTVSAMLVARFSEGKDWLKNKFA